MHVGCHDDDDDDDQMRRYSRSDRYRLLAETIQLGRISVPATIFIVLAAVLLTWRIVVALNVHLPKGRRNVSGRKQNDSQFKSSGIKV